SPLIALNQIGRLAMLEALFDQVMAPPAVVREVAPSVGAIPPWLREAWVAPLLGLPDPLGPGEREAIALAVHLSANFILVDDSQGRRAAVDRGLKTIGSLGLLVRARRRGLIKAVRPEMDAMVAVGLYVSSELYLEILELGPVGKITTKGGSRR